MGCEGLPHQLHVHHELEDPEDLLQRVLLQRAEHAVERERAPGRRDRALRRRHVPRDHDVLLVLPVLGPDRGPDEVRTPLQDLEGWGGARTASNALGS